MKNFFWPECNGFLIDEKVHLYMFTKKRKMYFLTRAECIDLSDPGISARIQFESEKIRQIDLIRLKKLGSLALKSKKFN